MAVTITRTAWIDDDGSGTTGTVINNAIKTELYNQIDGALAKVLPLTTGTVDGADNQMISIAGGGAASVARGGYLGVYGNEYPTYGGKVAIAAGDVATGDIAFYTGATIQRFTITQTGHLAMASGARLFLDGVLGTGDTYLTEGAANQMWFVANNVQIGGIYTQGLFVAAGKVIELSGGANRAYIWESAANNLAIQAGGTGGVQLTSGATAWSAYSDDRQKTDWRPFTDAAAKLRTLRAGTGRYLTDDPARRRSFLSGQDVQQVLPEAIDIDPDGLLQLRYTDVIPLLVAAVQEQQQAIDALQMGR